MEDVIRQNLIRLGVKRGDTLGVAVSGGIDSMALLHCVCRFREETGITVVAFHFEHGIRDVQSQDDMAFVQARCREYGIKCICQCADVPRIAKETGQSVEAAARQERYAFLDSQDADYIATAHHMDDVAETVLLNLVRGAGLRGLGGIPERRGRFIRPMLGVTRRQIEGYACAQGIAYRHDSTNDDTSYARNYIRHEILPRLENVNAAAAQNIARASALLRDDEDALTQMAQSAGCTSTESDGVYIDLAAWAALPEAVQKRIVRLAIAQCAGLKDIENVHVQSVMALAQGAQAGKRVDIGGALFAAVVYDKLMIGKHNGVRYNDALVFFYGPGRYTVGHAVFDCRVVDGAPEYCAGCEYFDADTIKNAQFRHRQTGDRIVPLGMKGTKRLSDYLSDRKVPLHQRDALIVLADGSDVFWVVGVGISDVSKVKKDGKIIKITVGENEYA